MTRRAWAVLAVLFVAAAGLAALQGPRFTDWNRYRDTVERVASAGLGRPVRIAGPIRLSLLPQATLRAGDVTIADTGDGASASVGELRMRVGLGALLTGRVEPQDLVLQGARMRLPWPMAGFAPRLFPGGALHARVEDGTLRVGDLPITAISGELSAGGDGGLSASGFATLWGRPWRMTGRLGRPGTDGAATVAVSLDGAEDIGTGGALAGQMAADGSVSGRITGRGPDLSVLLPAPPSPWRADGRLVAGSGLIVADDLELVIAGSPSRGAVALRLLPELRLDAALATNRLDLDAWLPPLLQGAPVKLPTGIDLSAEAAPFAGGTLRRLRAGFDLKGTSVTLRPSDVVLPGDAPLQLSGVFARGQFSGSARLSTPDLPQTVAWLQSQAPTLAAVLPLGRLHTATLAAAVQADRASLAFGNLTGEVDGVPIGGNVALRGGSHPALAADLRLTGPVLDQILAVVPAPSQAAAALAAVPQWAAGFDADVSLSADRPVWRGTAYDRLSLSGAVRGGAVELRQAALSGAGLSVVASGMLDPAARITDGKFALMLGDATWLGATLPPALQPAAPLLRGPVAVEASMSGPAGALATVARLEAADARLNLNGRADLPGRHWAGSVSFHHPGAPRFLASLGWGGLAGWLGDGSLSGEGTVDATPGRAVLGGFTLSAGALRGTGALTLSLPDSGRPNVAGTLDIDTLPVPLPAIRSAGPLAFEALRTIDAALTVRAAHLLWGASPVGDAASARIALSGGTLRLDDVNARLAGGTLAGALAVDSATDTPQVHVAATLSGAVLDGAAFSSGIDLIAGMVSGSLDAAAHGHSPAALAASLHGTVAASVRDGALSGLDAGQLLSALRSGTTLQAGVTDALRRGATPFATLDAAGTVANGLITLGRGVIQAPAASIDLAGSLDLPGDTLDLSLSLHPALDGAPPIGLRLIGPTANPSRTPGLADLVRWQATQ